MAAGANDDDGLYGDLYGAEDELPEDDPFQVDFEKLRESTAPVSYASGSEPKTVKNERENTKPTSSGSSEKTSKQTDPSNSSASYSAQIAMQFSSYNQTPSQERNQRPSAIPTYSTDNSFSVPQTSEPRTRNALSGSQIKPSEMKDEGKIFIGGLSWDTTDEGLNEYFGQFGKIDASVILRDAEGRSRGFAFLTYEDPNSVSKVLAKSHFLDGKSIDPKRAIPRSSHHRAQRFFVGGLSPTSTTDSLRMFFSQFGQVMDINVMMDRETGRNKGYAFATFEDLPEHEVSRIIGGGWEVDDKVVEIKLAQPRPPKRQDHESLNGASIGNGLSKIGTYTSDSPRSFNQGGEVDKGTQRQQQDMSALYQRMMGRMGAMGANANPAMMFNGVAHMNMRNMQGMSSMGGMGMGGMNMGSMGMNNPGMMNGAMMPGAMGGGMGMGMMNMGMNPMMRLGGGGMGGMGYGMGPQGAMGMGGNMMANPQMQMSPMNNNMQPNQASSGGPALRLGSGPLSTGMDAGMGMGNGANMGMRGGAVRGRGGVGPARTMSRAGNFHPYSR